MQLQRFHKAKIITFTNNSNNNDNEITEKKIDTFKFIKCNESLKVFCDDFSYGRN